MSEKSFKKQISETILHLLQKENFSNDDQLKLAECEKILKRINKRKDALKLDKHIESERTARFTSAMGLLAEILHKFYEKNSFNFDEEQAEVETKSENDNEMDAKLDTEIDSFQKEVDEQIKNEPLRSKCVVLNSLLTEDQFTKIEEVLGELYPHFENLLCSQNEDEAKEALAKLRASITMSDIEKLGKLLNILDNKQQLHFNSLLFD